MGAAVALPALPTPPAAGQAAVWVHSPSPAPHAVVRSGPQPVGAVVEGGTGEVWLDGEPVEGVGSTDALGRTLVRADLTSGRHLLQVRVDGEVRREWTVLASDLPVQPLPGDELSVGLAASGSAPGPRTVLLVNPERPELALAAGPLGVATGAVVLPTGQAALPASTADALQAAAGEGGRVLLLGGLDAIGAGVAEALAVEGYAVVRVGSGSPAEVAAAAAARAPFAEVYRRGGAGPARRPALVAPVSPLAGALRAAADAARLGASLLLVAEGQVAPAAREVLATRDVVLLATGTGGEVEQQVRDAARPGTRIAPVPPSAGPATAWVVDGDAAPGLAVLAARAAGPEVEVLTDLAAAREAVLRGSHEAVLAVGGEPAATLVRAWDVDGPAAPAVEAVVESGPVVRLQAAAALQGWNIHVTVHDREWEGTTTIEAATLTWRPGPRPRLPDGLEPAGTADAPLVVTAVVAVDGAERHLRLDQVVPIGPRSTASPEGYRVAGGSSAVVGTGGPLRTFTVEVQPATGLDLEEVTREATDILLDPRGWTARGERRLQRIADPAQADIRVVVATPATVDANCRAVGLDTGGRLSCWDGRRANLNLDRWMTGVAPFHTDLAVYRQYLVSHEVGHGLGYRHVSCPGTGQVAPVMMQQSKGLSGCTANGWPHPTG